MRKEEVKMILILLLISAVIIGGLLIWSNSKKENAPSGTGPIEQSEEPGEEYVQKLEDGSKLNVSDELLKAKTVGDLQITNIQLKEKGGITTLLADVENKSSQRSQSKILKVEILDKEGKIITDLRGEIPEIPAGGKTQLNVGVTSDVSNAYDFRISE